MLLLFLMGSCMCVLCPTVFTMLPRGLFVALVLLAWGPAAVYPAVTNQLSVTLAVPATLYIARDEMRPGAVLSGGQHIQRNPFNPTETRFSVTSCS